MTASHEIILKYFSGLSKEQVNRFALLQEVYADWNSKINVISRKDIDNLYVNHVLHSLGIAKVIQFKSGTSVLDVGTGGGFPGIPLAILFPEVKFHLVDSIGKKITVVNEVVDALQLKNVLATKSRAEELKEKYDFIVSRAVTTLPEFYQWTRWMVKRESLNEMHNGILLLKGGDLEEEIKSLNKKVMVFELKKFFEEEFFETKKVAYLSC
jgi:16S rRNA (guanine527-N7)-methyltransferase